LDCPIEILPHISSLGWGHILITGEYRWSNRWNDSLDQMSVLSR
jgi:hypothetical protein